MDVVINPTTIVSNDGAIIINLDYPENSNSPFFFSIDNGITWKSPDVKYGTSKTYDGLPPGKYTIMISRGSPGKCVTSKSYVLKAEFCCGKCNPPMAFTIRIKIPEQPFVIPNNGLAVVYVCHNKQSVFQGDGTVLLFPGTCTYTTLQQYRECIAARLEATFIGFPNEVAQVIGDTVVYSFHADTYSDEFNNILKELCNCNENVLVAASENPLLLNLKAEMSIECCLDKGDLEPDNTPNVQRYFCENPPPTIDPPPANISHNILISPGVYTYTIQVNTCCYSRGGNNELSIFLPPISSLENGKFYTFEIYSSCCDPSPPGRVVKLRASGIDELRGTSGTPGGNVVDLNECRVHRATLLKGTDTEYNVFRYNNDY